jgi:hypothetical protein
MVVMYSQLIKILKGLMVISTFSLVIILIARFLVHSNELKIHISCEKENSTINYCNFNCSFFIECQGLASGRFIILHHNWDAIYDRRFEAFCNQKNNLSVQVPKRLYNFKFLSTFYDNYSYGISEDFLFC